MMDFTLQMPVPDALDQFLMGGPLLSALRANSPAIALTLINKLRDRTPHNTGALAEDETAQPYTDPVAGARTVNLVKFYTDSSAQLSEWGRVYAAYQEGPPLGLATYTNAPHQMFFLMQSADLGDIAAWAEATLDAAIGDLTGALPTETIGTGGL